MTKTSCLKTVFAALALCVPALAVSAAFAQGTGNSSPLEMEQLQAQVDVMLEEMSELQGYRICGEQGLVYAPTTPGADEEGCVQPETSAPTLEAPRIVGGELAPTAKTFKLAPSPRATKGGENIPLKSIGEAAAIENSFEKAAPVQANKPIQPANAAAPKAVDPVPELEADYPSDRVRALVEMAVAQALEGAKKANVAEGDVIQAPESAVNAPLADVSPSMKQNAENRALQSAQGALIPSCAKGEFLTVMGGEVVCRRAASAGKMACPPAVLRTFVDWHDKHIHFHVPYTPHGQTRTAQEESDIIKVECDNNVYKLREITRNECGGVVCQEGRKPAYSMTFYCAQDKTNRCYAKQNGQLVNHTYSKSYINKQY